MGVGMRGAEGASALVVTIGRRACALRLPDVAEVMRPLPVEPISGAPHFVLGLCVIRGAALPVVDLTALLEVRPGIACGRFVSVKAGDRSLALAVDSVIGVRNLEHAQLLGLPPLLEDAQVIEAVGAADAQLLLVLRAARLVPDEAWPSLAVEISRR